MLSSIKKTKLNFRHRFSLYYCSRKLHWMLCIVFLYCLNNNPSIAAEKLAFYLPLHSSQHPKLVSELEHALQISGLDNLKVRTADYWQGYQQGIRLGRKGVYFAAPHFAAWSINQHDFAPIVRLDEPLKYVIAIRRKNSQYFEINDLARQKVCSERALNLDYLLVNTGFDNPVLSANTVAVWSVMDEIVDQNTDCVAFAISDHAFNRLEKNKPREFIRLQQGPRFNNYTFVAHPNLNTALINKLRAFLLREDIQALMQPLFRPITTKAKLVNAYRRDYPLNYLTQLAPYWQRKK